MLPIFPWLCSLVFQVCKFACISGPWMLRSISIAKQEVIMVITKSIRSTIPRARFVSLLAVFFAIFCLGFYSAQGAEVSSNVVSPDTAEQGLSPEDEAAAREAALLEKAWQQERVRVIVALKRPMDDTSQADGRSGIAAVQTAVLDRVTQNFAINQQSVKLYSFVSYLALEADGAVLEALLEDPDVVGVYEDVPEPPGLFQSIPVMDVDDAWADGYTGSGHTVAVLDTGVNKNHPFLSGKVVSEACYSTTGSGSTSLCPGGASSSTASGSGLDCPGPSASGGADGCGHGTHVAGIAAGTNASTSGGTTFHGVARNARIIAIKVFSRFASASDCSPNPSPCVLAWTSDQILGLERVYALRNTYSIAAANMSLGGGSSTGTCDSDSRKAIIDLLRSAGIATVASSGNSGFRNAMGAPGCISTAISVGSTTKSDVFSSFSNVSASTDLLATGSSICSSTNGSGSVGSSSLCGTGVGYASGTSMSAPHVAGAWAVMKSKNGFASVTSIESALESTGKAVTDTRSGGIYTKPRIDLDNALGQIAPGPQRGFTWDHCEHIWQSGNSTWCYTKGGRFWISSSNDLTEKAFIEAVASTPKSSSSNSKFIGYYVSSSGAISYVRLWEY